ncbi:hypothetical protein Tco_1132777 [Tanacetum coccineum]|uniref:Uncharacterized protein n=1 Tax=Tanacetum coccineum TaxID=301880 RepID=A0ABQ5JDJ8_9ASTR
MKEQLQGKNHTIRNLKEKISHMNKRRSDADRNLDFKALDSQNIELKENVTALHEQNITRAKTIEKTPSLLTEIEKLKTQLKGKMQCVTRNTVKPKVLAPETLREIVEEARIERPLDNALDNACFSTKRS